MRYTAAGFAALLLFGCGGGDSTGPSPQPPAPEPGFGTIEVVTSTSGGILDDDGYTLVLSYDVRDEDGKLAGTIEDSLKVAPNDTIVLRRKAEGMHSLALLGLTVAPQCTPTQWGSSVVVRKDETSRVRFTIVCDPVVPPTSVRPSPGWTVPQNNASSGCPYHDTAGYGFVLNSSWMPARSNAGIKEYELVIERRFAPNVRLVNTRLTDERFVYKSCGFYDDTTAGLQPRCSAVTGTLFCLYGEWRVRVRALDNAGNWSKATENWFALGYCRLSDGSPCS